MSNARVISQADLTGITRALSELATATTQLRGHVGAIASEQVVMKGRLEGLIEAFSAFYEEDKRAKALQLAETRIVKVRQELETRFGYYAEVRRLATGLLQGVDANLVGADTVRFVSEELLIKAPGYWLAATLVALSAWLRDDRPMAERALGQALRQDDCKVSLFFALVSKRVGRPAAAGIWTQRYFQNQNPRALDREVVVLLDAVASGVLGVEARVGAIAVVKAWLDELAATASYTEDQEKRWSTALGTLGSLEEIKTYPNMKRYVSGWDQLERSLREARRHAATQEHFRRILEGELRVSPRLTEEVDAILTNLATHFDDEELPLRGQERALQLIIDAEGNKALADERFAAERKAFDEKLDFGQLLANASLTPELAHASVATQRLAVALSAPWIVAAYDTNTARSRAAVPRTVHVTIDDWTVSTSDGHDEAALLEAQAVEYQSRKARAVAAIKIPAAVFVCPAIALILLVASLTVGVVALLFLGGYAALEASRLAGRRRDAAKEVAERHAKAEAILRAVVAELVDYRQEWTKEDARAEKVRETLSSISADQLIRTRPSDARNVLR